MVGLQKRGKKEHELTQRQHQDYDGTIHHTAPGSLKQRSPHET